MRCRFVILFAVMATFFANVSSASAVTTLSKGVNLGDWLDQDEAYYVQTTRYALKDFQDIQSLGCDHVRITVNFDTWENAAPDYQISPIFTRCLDKALGFAAEAGLKVVIANTGFDNIADGTVETVKEQLAASWKNVAARYADRADDLVLYEILASPGETISAENWGATAGAVVAAIREADSKHTVVVGGINNYSLDALAAMTPLSDGNVLYTFEFFEPVTFTHQGRSYDEVDYNTHVVPFPADAGTLPALDVEDTAAVVVEAYNNYSTQGTVAYVQSRIDIAAQFAADNSVPVWCAAMGTTDGQGNPLTGWYLPEEYRVAWLEAVRGRLEEKGIGWTLSGWRGNFGPHFDYNTDPDIWLQYGVFPYDINTTIVEALGLTAPEVDLYYPEMWTGTFVIYDDEVTPLARVGWWLGDGEPSFFVEDDPASGQYCMGIFYPGQWNAVDFFFPLHQDLSALVEDGYALEFFIRCDDPTGHIEARFEDTNEDLEELPWRMNKHIDDNFVPFDGTWQHVSLPLSEMDDQGAWDPDDQTWYGGGQGLQDWENVRRLQFVSETAEQPDTEIYLDRIRIVDPTAVERRATAQPDRLYLAANYPNPFNPTTRIEFSLPTASDVQLEIYNVRGERVKTLVSGRRAAGVHRAVWDGTDAQDLQVPSGIYFYRLETNDSRLVRRMALVR